MTLVELTESGRRVLVVGAIGSGKSTLVRESCDAVADVVVLSADPGSPELGPPAAVSVGRRVHGAWAIDDVEPLGTLDALRFRVPLMLAVRRILQRIEPGATVMIDGNMSSSRNCKRRRIRWFWYMLRK